MHLACADSTPVPVSEFLLVLYIEQRVHLLVLWLNPGHTNLDITCITVPKNVTLSYYINKKCFVTAAI